MFELIFNREIYQEVVIEQIPQAKNFVWIATSDIKNLHIHKNKRMVPFLKVLSELLESGVSVRLIHAKEPGTNFREDFDRYPALAANLERLLCPRVHFKSVIIDGHFAYNGSANLTGAGMGAKSDKRRNFENGFVTDEIKIVEQLMDQFDRVWMGSYCNDCGRAELCPDREDMVNEENG
ncbi:phospholipase D family protein [Chitinispirillales bacterium ANBcel5]|uniref:phospholipase D family protein n=1 Tax=Cellulosispirillum alkaliphilum TaxID=3039283 RepID=UPI002A539CC0|nr:phospholipase D family protein [Chitinispirillales bacterium ANBcel5]